MNRASNESSNSSGTEKPNVIMMKLGDYLFSVETAAYQSMKRDFTFGWQKEDDAKKKGKIYQFSSDRTDYKRSLSGVIYPEYKGGFNQIDDMVAQARKGKPLPLYMGAPANTRASSGRVVNLGFWCITQISETATIFYRNGLPRKLAFNMEMVFYGQTYQRGKK